MSDRPRPVELIEQCVTRYTAGLRFADPLNLIHEAERLETLPTTPAVTRMREAVTAEQARRVQASTRRVAPVVPDASRVPAGTTPQLVRAAA